MSKKFLGGKKAGEGSAVFLVEQFAVGSPHYREPT
jgi:hypothetical protein